MFPGDSGRGSDSNREHVIQVFPGGDSGRTRDSNREHVIQVFPVVLSVVPLPLSPPPLHLYHMFPGDYHDPYH